MPEDTIPLPPFHVGDIVPSMRDFLQAARTRRTTLSLIPLLSPEEAAREALRQAEADVAALAMLEPGAAMSEASGATRIPMLCLRAITGKQDYLAARAYGADAVVISPAVDDATAMDLAKGSRSTRMTALYCARDEAEIKRAVDAGTRGLLLKVASPAKVRAFAAHVPIGVTLIAWPDKADEEAVRSLRGLVDGAVVGIDVYGATGFERLVSEMTS